MGSSVIGLTGGEPLLREDLEDIIASIDKRSMPVMFTTGYKLTRKRVKSLKKPVQEIWEQTSQHFCTPGPKCYANISNDVVFSKKAAEWPLKKQATIDILNECPSYNEHRLPEFYKRMGFIKNS